MCGRSTITAFGKAGRSRTASARCSRLARCRPKARYFGRIDPSPRGTAGARWRTSSYLLDVRPARARRLASVFAPELVERLVGHGRPAVRVEKRPRETLAEVVLQRPDPRSEVVVRIAKPGLPHVDEAAQLSVLDEHVGQAVVAVDEHIAASAHAEWATSRVGRMQDAKDLAELGRHPAWLPAV